MLVVHHDKTIVLKLFQTMAHMAKQISVMAFLCAMWKISYGFTYVFECLKVCFTWNENNFYYQNMQGHNCCAAYQYLRNSAIGDTWLLFFVCVSHCFPDTTTLNFIHVRESIWSFNHGVNFHSSHLPEKHVLFLLLTEHMLVFGSFFVSAPLLQSLARSWNMGHCVVK